MNPPEPYACQTTYRQCPVPSKLFVAVIRTYAIMLAVTVLIAGSSVTNAHAQNEGSAATAPVLDSRLKDMMRSMTIINDAHMPVLDNQALVIAFFASWCPPCRPEFAELNTLRQAFAEQDVAIIAVNIFEGHFEDSNGKRMKRFLAATRPGFPVIQPDTDAQTKHLFGGIDRIPTVYVYDRTGHPTYTFIHQQGATKMHTTAAEIMPHINAALAPSTP